MFRSKKTAIMLAAGLLGLVLFTGGLSRGQEASVPFYSEETARSNVMLLIDSSGSMIQNQVPGDPENRNRLQVVTDVLVGHAIRTIVNGNNLYVPHTDSNNGAYSVRDEVEEVMPKIFWVYWNNTRSRYQCDTNRNGPYFVFWGPADTTLGNSCPDGADTLDNYMRIRNMNYINRITAIPSVTSVRMQNGTSYIRDIFQATNTSTGNLIYGDALRNYWYYKTTGIVGGIIDTLTPIDTRVVPVYYVPIDTTIPWTGPQSPGVSYVGLCSNYGSTWHDCYKPTATSPYFVLNSAVSALNGEQVVLNRQLMSAWRAANGTPAAYCAYATAYDVWGDGPYSQWTRNNISLAPLKDQTTFPASRQVYQGCAATAAGAEVYPPPVPTDAQIIAAIEGTLPFAQTVDWALDGTAGPEFLLTTSGERLDIYIRRELGISPPDPLMGSTEINDKNFNHYFDWLDGTTYRRLTYDNHYHEDPGIMDVYTKVNYGLMIYDNGEDSYPSGTPLRCPTTDDFPPDRVPVSSSVEDCVGAQVQTNLTTWADFPYYKSATVTVDTRNQALQDYIKTGAVDAGGWTPIASSLHDMYRYFYNTGFQTGTGNNTAANLKATRDRNEVAHTMFYNLSYPTASGTEATNSVHIVQGDSFYVNGCRRNFGIFLTDGEQTQGEPLFSTGTNLSDDQLAQVIASQVHWVEMLKGGTPTTSTSPLLIFRGVKMFFIGFGEGISASTDAVAELEAMAAASYMGEDDLAEYLPADNQAGLMDKMTQIFNEIMASNYARTAPEVSSLEDVILTTYFEVTPSSPLWRGHLFAYDLTLAPGQTIYDYYWQDYVDAAARLNAANPAHQYLFTSMIGDSPAHVVFDESNWSTLLPEFDPSPGNLWSGTVEEDMSRKLIKFMRGDGGSDPATFTSGDTLLWKMGAIYHSRPRLVKAPRSALLNKFPNYDLFMTAHKDRPPIIYVGDLYGVLHAFNLRNGDTTSGIPVDGGAELFGYVPRPLLRYLHLLREGIQIAGADGTPVFDDVLFNMGTPELTDDEWRTVLIAGLGAGGTAYYALDITNVTNEANNWVDNAVPLWNFTERRLGQTWSVPVNGLIRWTDPDTSNLFITPASFFGGGLQKNQAGLIEDQGGFFYVINLETGNTLAIFEVPDVNQVTTLKPLALNLAQPNTNQVPSSPTIIDKDGDGYYDWSYFGDMEGRVWKINVHSPDRDNWKLCLFWDSADDPLTSDVDVENPTWRKPIWYTPSLVYGPNNSLLVFFATGYVEIREDAGDETQVNHMMAIKDKDSIMGCNYGTPFTTAEAGTTVLWPLTFEAGEKPITQEYASEGKLIFKTYLPTSSVACSKGTVRLYTLDYITAKSTATNPATGESVPYIVTKSTSELSIDEEGNVWQIGDIPELNEEGGADPEKVHEGSGNVALPLSWGEGITW